MPLKSALGVIQGQWKWQVSFHRPYTTSCQSTVVIIALPVCCTIFKLFDLEKGWDLEGSLKIIWNGTIWHHILNQDWIGLDWICRDLSSIIHVTVVTFLYRFGDSWSFHPSLVIIIYHRIIHQISNRG